jgi:hypothetical protein
MGSGFQSYAEHIISMKNLGFMMDTGTVSYFLAGCNTGEQVVHLILIVINADFPVFPLRQKRWHMSQTAKSLVRTSPLVYGSVEMQINILNFLSN